MMFSITENAVKIIKEAAKQSNIETLILRIAAKNNQDGSIEYGMGFDESKDTDIKIPYDDVEIVIDPTSNELLEEATMDYVELEPGQFNFIFMNPLDPNYKPPKKKKTDK
jgi:iron-sulfur cluster assembly protein